MNKIFYAFRLKLILLSMLILLVILTIVHIVVYVTTKNIVMEQISLSSQSVAVSVSTYIMTDIDSYKQFLETKDADSEYYIQMREYLAAVKSAGNIKFIYTERPVNDETVEFMLDAEPPDGEYYTPPGTTTFMDSASAAVYATGLPATLEATASDFGTLIGGSAPIFDSNGEMLGLTGVNIDATVAVNHLNRLQIVMFAIYVIMAALVYFALRKYSGLIFDPMFKDKLTGAYSKRHLERMMQGEIKAARKNETALCLMMCDLDHFKKINDTYGHSFGDVVLSSVAQTIMSCLRKTDIFFRYGGEEFIVVLAKSDLETVTKIAERIRGAVEKNDIINENDDSHINITISIGVAKLNASAAEWKILVENSDKALYEAKKTRNSVAVFEA